MPTPSKYSHWVGIRNSSDYSPFGVELDGRTVSLEGYRFGYQNQEKDDEIKGEGNSINYTFRMHDPRLGRFFAVDPFASKYPFFSPYAFSGNRIIDAVELEGLQPGVLFDTPREAALDWGFHYADESVRNNKEYASCIYVVKSEGVIKYAYSEPNIGTAHKSNVPDSPNGEEIVADVHSHGAYEGYDHEHFFSGESIYHNSEANKNNFENGTDIGAYNLSVNLGYLVNHRGELRVYNPKTGETKSASTALPVDPRDPIQYNENVVKPYNNIINLGSITFNSDKVRKSNKGDWLIVKDLETNKDFGVIRNDDGSYRFKTQKDD